MTLSTKYKQTFRKSTEEPNMDFLCNFLYESYRWRVFNKRFFYRPLSETFAEFLGYFLKSQFDENWVKEQEQKQRKDQHVIYRWAQDCVTSKIAGCPDQEVEEDGSVSFIPSGPILSWLAFGYDLLCLFHKKVLPKKLLNRLANHNEFQGAWFEVAIAATLLRAGCDIQWINDTSKRNCELIATHRTTNIQFGVEAKSRKRNNVFNHTGFEESKNTNCAGLVQKGLGQAPSELPYVLFTDLNIPVTHNIPRMEKPILNEVKGILDSFQEASEEYPDKFSLLVTTSFGFHYGELNIPAQLHDHCFVLPQHTRYPLPIYIINDITTSVKRYGMIPEEI